MPDVKLPFDPGAIDTHAEHVLGFFARQSPFSAPGRHAALFDALPADPARIASVIQGLVIYEHVAEPFYGYRLPDLRRAESHIRHVARMIDVLLALDNRPLFAARSPEKRLVGICHHYMMLAVAIFRHHGIPARGRGGFASYFNPGKWEDHWVCEYWKADERRWAILDAQFDEVFTRRLMIGHNVLDVPRDQFLTSPSAWQKCRSGELDPQAFGIEFTQLRGLWFVAASLVRDLAALNGSEVLPWDCWGAQPSPNTELSADELAFFDELAALTINPDATFDAIRERFANDPRVCLPETVLNALRQREETVATYWAA